MMIKILIAVPTFENISPDTFKSIYGLTRPQDTIIQFDYIKGYDCARARNLIAKEAIEYGFDYVLMVDSDITLPSDTLIKMLDQPVDVCLGCYPRKNTIDEIVELFKLNQKDYVTTFKAEEIDSFKGRVEVKGGGFGCAFIKVDVFNKLKYPWFKYVEYDNGDILSEDNYFCSTLADKKIKIYAHTDIRCGHTVHKSQWR